MKNWKKIAILFVILVAFATAFILLNNNQKKLDAAEASPSASNSADKLKLIEMEKDKVIKIILRRGSGDIVLSLEEREVEKLNQKEDGTTEKVKEKAKVWVNSDFDLDDHAVKNITLAAETATTTRLIEEDPKDLAIYGLDKPVVTTFVSEDGTQESVEIGNMTPTGEGYYVRKAGNASVYTLDSYKGNSFVYGKLDLMNKNLYGTETLTIDDVTTFSLTKAGEKVFDFEYDEASSNWMINYPMARKADMQEMSKFLQWVVYFRATDFADDNAGDLKSYGLDNPNYVFDYTLGGKSYSMKVGSLNDSQYFAKLDDKPAVFTFDSASLSFIDVPLIDVIDTFAYIPLIYDIEKLVIEFDGRVDELLIDAEQSDDYEEKFYLNGKKIEGEDNASLFKKYYQGAIGISGDKVDLKAEPSGRPFAKLTYTLKKASPDKTVTVELVPTGDGYGYYLMKNGQYTGMVMGERQLDEKDFGIRWYYEQLMEGLAATQ